LPKRAFASEAASEESFDRAYVKQTIDDQRAALPLTRRAASEVQDANVKALAAKAAPHIEKQLEIGRQPGCEFPACHPGTMGQCHDE
jgi:predicted outer membrane protein